MYTCEQCGWFYACSKGKVANKSCKDFTLPENIGLTCTHCAFQDECDKSNPHSMCNELSLKEEFTYHVSYLSDGNTLVPVVQTTDDVIVSFKDQDFLFSPKEDCIELIPIKVRDGKIIKTNYNLEKKEEIAFASQIKVLDNFSFPLFTSVNPDEPNLWAERYLIRKPHKIVFTRYKWKGETLKELLENNANLEELIIKEFEGEERNFLLQLYNGDIINNLNEKNIEWKDEKLAYFINHILAGRC